MEVFKDRLGRGDECQQCGAAIPATPTPATEETLERCAFCAAVLERFGDDPWLKAKLALFTAAIPELQRAGTLDAPEAVLAALAFVNSALGRVDPARIAIFIRRALPWLSAPVLERGLALCLQYRIVPEVRPSFEAVISELKSWTPYPACRPLPPVSPSGFDAAAWLEKSVVLFGLAAPATRVEERVVQVLSIALADVLAAPLGASPPITAEDVLAFYARVLPRVARTTLHSALAPISGGGADTAAGPLVRELMDSLGR